MVRDRASESTESRFLENPREHVFISHVLQEAWLGRDERVEILRSAVDDSGYDLVLECGGIVRHVQLKSSRIDATTENQKVNVKLADKPAGCVIWLLWEEDTTSHRIKFKYLFYGEGPREPLTGIYGLPVAKHTKADSTGLKKERPNIRVIKKNEFRQIATIHALMDTLFGPRQNRHASS